MLSKLLLMLRSASVCSALLLAAAASAQKTINVGPGQAYTSIQAGINAAGDGDTVLVSPGTYRENIDFQGKAITVMSSKGAGATVIDGSLGQNPVVVFRNQETSKSVLNGFTIKGGGYEISPAPAGSYGTGGILIEHATPTIENNAITQNHCNGIESDASSPLIQNNEIDTTLNGNDTCGVAGGSAISLSGSLNYNGDAQAGAVPARVEGNLIQNNTESGVAGGAGIAIWGADAYVAGNTIRNNVTIGDGGGILTVNAANVMLIGNLIYGNQAGIDGAIALEQPRTLVGAFIGIVGSNTIYGNKQTSSSGGMYGDVPPTEVYLTGGLGQYLLVNNIIVGAGKGTVAVSCGTVYNYLSITPLVFDHNDLYNPGGANYGGACPDQTGTFGNISADPQFANTANLDFSLRAGSPAIDAGNNSAPQLLSTDMDSSPRIQDASGKGYPIVDMGAYEFSGTQDAAPTILTLTPSEYFTATSPSDQSGLTFTSTLTSRAGTPSGPVTIFVDGVQFSVVQVEASGTVTYSLRGLTPGLHAFTSSYAGSGIFPAATSVKFYLLLPNAGTSVQLTSAPNPSVYGNPVTFTIAASSSDGSVPSPVTLMDNTTNTLLATLTPDSAGNATYTTSALTIAYHSITAAFAGDATRGSASSSVLQNVTSGNSTTLNCSSSSIGIGETELLSAAVTSVNGTPMGSIAFTDNGAALATKAVVSGAASLTYTGASVGSHTLTATYVPAGNLAGSSASCFVTVNIAPTTAVLTVNPANSSYGSPVTLTATVAPATAPGAGAPTGVVAFSNGGAGIGIANLVNGTATIALSSLPVGSDNLTCSYGGDAVYAASQCNVVPAVVSAEATSLTVASSGSPAPALSTVTFTVHLNAKGQSAPAGNTVSLGVNGATQTLTTDATGSASYSTSALTPGSYPVTANFPGTANLRGSGSSLIQVITAIPTAVMLTVSPNPAYPGQTVAMTATCAVAGSAMPCGSVTFYDGNTVLGTGAVTPGFNQIFSTSTLAVGTHPITAKLTPDGLDYLGSTSAVVNEMVLASGFTVGLSPSSVTIARGSSGTVGIQLQSVGGFAGPLALTYGALPANASASLNPASVMLSANGAGSSTLVFSTLLRASDSRPARPGARDVPVVLAAVMLLMLPFGASRRMRRRLLLGVMLVVSLQGIVGCTTLYYPAEIVSSGTYQVPVAATDVNGNRQTAVLTVVVTQ